MIDRGQFIIGALGAAISEGSSDRQKGDAARDVEMAYVACEANDSLAVVDLRARRVTHYARVGSRPTGVVLHPNRLQVSVTNFASNSISVYDIPTATIVAAIQTEGGPSAMVLAPGKPTLYVCNVLSGSVTSIDVDKGRALSSVPVGTHPTDIATLGGTRAIVVNAGVGTVTIFDVDGRPGSTKTISVDRAASSLAISADGSTAFIGNARANSLSVLDLKDERIIATIPGLYEPRGLAVANDRTLFVAEAGSNSIAIVDVAGRAVLDRVGAGRRPYVVRLGPHGTVLTLNYDADSLSIVDPVRRRVNATIAGLSRPLGIATA